MTKAEALKLASQLGPDFADVESGVCLITKCHKLGYKLGLDHATGDWVVWDENDRVLARCL